MINIINIKTKKLIWSFFLFFFLHNTFFRQKITYMYNLYVYIQSWLYKLSYIFYIYIYTYIFFIHLEFFYLFFLLVTSIISLRSSWNKG